MSDIVSVNYKDCLNYIDRDIGFCDRFPSTSGNVNPLSFGFNATGNVSDLSVNIYNVIVASNFILWHHDTSKRKIGLVREVCDDGGFIVSILANEKIEYTTERSNVNNFGVSIEESNSGRYYTDQPLTNHIAFDRDNYNVLPTYENDAWGYNYFPAGSIWYDELFNYTPQPAPTDFNDSGIDLFSHNFSFNGVDYPTNNDYMLTGDKDTTLTFGVKRTGNYVMWDLLRMNPTIGARGNLYGILTDMRALGRGLMPDSFEDAIFLASYNRTYGEPISNYSYVSVPFNLMLTFNENDAIAYLNNGTVPSDAFLFPMDWENLPIWSQPDDDGDGDDTNDDGDNDRDFDSNLPSPVVFTPAMLSNYNFYWLQASEYADFIRWFWNDVGQIQDFDDIVNKIEGLYNDLNSAVLFARYYPVTDVRHIGGLGSDENIVVGMIEKSGSQVNTISKTTTTPIVPIGSITIDSNTFKMYNSFLDLSPYSELVLYLPLHGFISLDINIFNGHSIDIMGAYDFLSGTLQYYIYYDNTSLINTVIVKMAIDLPYTLQSKNDRDSAIFQNITSAVGGLVGAGVTLGTGNPVGLLVGANAFNSGTSSAPINVRGTQGELGAFMAPSKCAVLLRRPTISKPKNYKNVVGQVCGKDYTLNNLVGKGLTTCYKPRISFTATTPYQEEIDEIYDYLEKGVIL